MGQFNFKSQRGAQKRFGTNPAYNAETARAERQAAEAAAAKRTERDALRGSDGLEHSGERY